MDTKPPVPEIPIADPISEPPIPALPDPNVPHGLQIGSKTLSVATGVEARLTPKELLAIGLMYVVNVPLGYFIKIHEVGPSLVIGGFIAMATGVFIYHNRIEETAPPHTKVAAAAILAILCVLQGLVYQYFLHWIDASFTPLFLCTATIFAMPFLLWNMIAKFVLEARHEE